MEELASCGVKLMGLQIAEVAAQRDASRSALKDLRAQLGTPL